MSGDLKKLYSEIIKAHNESPFYFEKNVNAPVVVKAYNPICGDRYDIYPAADKLSFHGYGCAISKASTSVMMKLLQGKTVGESLSLCDQFLRFANKEAKSSETILPDFLAFSGVHEFPERIDCATLAWKEMKKYLEAISK